MLTFNPGPSQISQATLEHLREIAESNFLSASHRSQAFRDCCQKALTHLRESLQIPKEMHVLFQPSATAAMDFVIKNFALKKSFHFVHGAFSQRFFCTAEENDLEASCLETPPHQAIHWKRFSLPSQTELICVTHNETSTGLMWPLEEIQELRKTYPDALIAIDVTSSLGALLMDFRNADIWFASVQKCLGLPSGMGLIFFHPRALERAQSILKKKSGVASWQNAQVCTKKIQMFETVETPNMLGIALLAKQMEHWNLKSIDAATKEKANLIYSSPLTWTSPIANPNWRSYTVAHLQGQNIEEAHAQALTKNFLLGKGYGEFHNKAFRIANFPVHSKQEIQALITSLNKAL